MVGEQLGWQVYDQEMLTFLANDEPARMELLRDLPPAERDWADSQFSDANTDLEPELMNAIRLTLALAARGDVVLVGRGSGFLLPNETTVHVRIVAPWESRVGYIAQSLRLPREDAVAEVRSRDEKRASLIQTLTGHDPTVASGYDLILNSARLGLESCAELIVQAVRLKQLSAAA
jgi:cytidylate kinase